VVDAHRPTGQRCVCHHRKVTRGHNRESSEWTRIAGIYAVGLVGGIIVMASVILAPFVMFGQNTTCTNHYDCTDSSCAECRPVVLAGIGHPLVQLALVFLAAYLLTRRLPRFVPIVVIMCWTLASLGAALSYLWWTDHWP
jgi:hypothetical protein